MPDDQFITGCVQRLREQVPNVAAILLKGSHARGEQGPYSDIDFDVLVQREPFEQYLAWFEDVGEGHLCHVSVAVQDIVGWMAESRDPVSWSYGLPAAETTRLLWAADPMLHHQLDHPARHHPPEEPELEDFIEAWGKVRNAVLLDDERAVRLAAQKLGRYCPGLLRLLNPEVCPSHRREALRAALAFPVAPVGYREDLLRCLGFSADGTTMTDLHDAARRLVYGTVHLMRGRADLFRGVLPDDLFGYLVNGTIDRYIRQ